MSFSKSEALLNAQRFSSRGDLTAAAKVYRQIIEADPFDFATVNALGELYVKAGRVAEAVDEFSRIADGYFATGFEINAAYVLKKILELDPSNAMVLIKLGDIYASQGMSEKARESFLAAEAAFLRSENTNAARAARERALRIKRDGRQPQPNTGGLRSQLLSSEGKPRDPVVANPQARSPVQPSRPDELRTSNGGSNGSSSGASPNAGPDSPGPARVGTRSVSPVGSTSTNLGSGNASPTVVVPSGGVRTSGAHPSTAPAATTIAGQPSAKSSAPPVNRAPLDSTTVLPKAVNPPAVGSTTVARPGGGPAGPGPTGAASTNVTSPSVAPATAAPSTVVQSTAAPPTAAPSAMTPPNAAPSIVSTGPTSTSIDDAFVIQQLSKAEMLVGYGDVAKAVEMLLEVVRQRPDNISVRVKLKDIYLRSAMMDRASDECFQIASLYAAQGDTERAMDYALRARRLDQLVQQPGQQPALNKPEVSAVARPASVAPPVSEKPVISPKPEKADQQLTEPVELPVQIAPATTPLNPPAEPDIPAPLSAPSAVAVPSEQESHQFEPVAETAVAILAESPSRAEAPSAITAPIEAQPKRRWLYMAAAAAICIAALSVAAIRGLPMYEARLDREFEELAQANPLPPVPEVSESTVLGDQPAEQIEVTSADTEDTQQAENTRPAPEKLTRTPEPQRNVREIQSPQPAFTPVQTKVNQPASKAPPMMAPLALGQPDRGSSGGVPVGMPGSSASSPEPPPPPPARPPGALIRGQSIRQVQPEYPSIAKSAGQAGSVTVEVSINEKGDVTSAHAISGPVMLRESAVSAARRWKFKPSTRDGKPVSSVSQITFNFKL